MGLDDKATPLLEETLAVRRSTLAGGHPDTLRSMNNLGSNYISVGRLESAAPLMEEVVDKCRGMFGSAHPNTLASIWTLGDLLAKLGRHAEAVPLLEEELQGLVAKHDSGTTASAYNLHNILEELGRTEDADALCQEFRLTMATLYADMEPIKCMFGFGARVLAAHSGAVAAATPPRAESTLTNGSSLAGKLVLVHRGGCSFVEKAKRVVEAGGLAMILVNNAPDRFAPSGSGVEIPVVGVGSRGGAQNYPKSRTAALELDFNS